MISWALSGDFHSHGATPIAGGFRREHIIQKWMMTWGYPYDLGNLHVCWSPSRATSKQEPNRCFESVTLTETVMEPKNGVAISAIFFYFWGEIDQQAAKTQYPPVSPIIFFWLKILLPKFLMGISSVNGWARLTQNDRFPEAFADWILWN